MNTFLTLVHAPLSRSDGTVLLGRLDDRLVDALRCWSSHSCWVWMCDAPLSASISPVCGFMSRYILLYVQLHVHVCAHFFAYVRVLYVRCTMCSHMCARMCVLCSHCMCVRLPYQARPLALGLDFDYCTSSDVITYVR